MYKYNYINKNWVSKTMSSTRGPQTAFQKTFNTDFKHLS